MPTSTTLSTLNINKLTRAQYDAAVQGGTIGATDISIITDESFDAVPQYSTMPTASADNVGEVVQYIGASDATYMHGFFYESVSDGGSPATYEWVNVQIQPESNNYADLVNKPSINNVELSGNKTTADLGIIEDVIQGSNVTIDKTDPLNPIISATGQVNSDWNSNSGLSQILNKPSLSTVATTGSYNDLSNKPTIPAAQVNSDWNAVSGVSQILNKPTLATVATSGDYSDLNNKPTFATVATSGSYNDLSNKPTIPAAQVNSDWNSSSGVSEILNKPDLSVYALDSDVTTIESYIPSATTALNQLADKAFVNSSISNMAANYVTSDAQGDNFATHAALINGPYYYKGQSYTLTNNDYALVESDEDHSNATTRYMYDGAQWAFQYVVNNAPFTQAQLDAINSTITSAKVTTYDSLVSNVQADWNASSGLAQILNKPSLATVATSGAYSDLSGTPSLATVATSGSYSDLSGTPTIPTVNNPTITITQGGVTKGSFTLNQASGDTIALDAGGGGGSVSIDNVTITENLSQEIQAIGTVNANSSNVSAPNVFDWVGTLSQYTTQNIASTHPDWVCYITDDEAPAGHNVIAFQEPTSLNNYTWYRKYADGWVEQGGRTANFVNTASSSGDGKSVTLPIEMADAYYSVDVTRGSDTTLGNGSVSGWANRHLCVVSQATTGFTLDEYATATANGTSVIGLWKVSGMAA